MSICSRCCYWPFCCWSSEEDVDKSEWAAAQLNDDDCESDAESVAEKHTKKKWSATPKSWTSAECILIIRLDASFEQDPKYRRELEHFPTEIKPCGEKTSRILQDVDIQSIRDFFGQDEDSPLLAAAGNFGSCKFVVTTWSNGTSGKRRFGFVAKPSENAYATIVKMNAPEKTDVIMWVQMDTSEDFVRILRTTSTPKVEYGKDFFVDEYLTFEKHPTGGVKFEFHTNVRWITKYRALNPKYRAAAGYIKSESEHAGLKSADFLARHLQERALQAQQPEITESTVIRTLSEFLALDKQTSQVQETGSQKIHVPVASPRAALLPDEAGKDAKIKKYLEQRIVMAEQELIDAKHLLRSIGDTDASKQYIAGDDDTAGRQ